MAIIGSHVLLYTPEAEALRSVLRDALRWGHVDAGEGWLIFALPPAELGVHPSDSVRHELTLMCDDLDATVGELRDHGLEVTGDPRDAGFGRFVTLVLPGGVEIMLYEPSHPTAI